MGLGLETSLENSIVTTRLDHAVNWGRTYSLWPMIFGTACCAIEFMSVASSKYDISRFGAEVVRFSPRQADLLIIAGTISYKQAPILKKIYDQMSEPKWVISAGHVPAVVDFTTTIPPCKVLIASFLWMFMWQDVLLVRKHF